MASTEKYLNQLIEDKKTLAANLTEKGVEATEDETFTDLVPKVLDIESGGATIEKGVVINASDSDGYVTDASVVGMTTIPAYYFQGTMGASSYWKKIGSNLHLPDEITSIGTYAFHNCGILALTNLPNALTDIGNNAFYSCSKLAITNFPQNLKTIGSHVFYQCTSLTDVTIPSGVTKIENTTFTRCSNLAKVTLKGNITSIGMAFNQCTVLDTFVLENVASVPALGANAFSVTSIESGTGYIYVPDALVEDFKIATNWSTYAAQIKPLSELPTE